LPSCYVCWRHVWYRGRLTVERNYAQAILEHSGGDTADLSGQLSLQELAALIAGARCFIGLDSVAMHLSAAIGTPCVALFGPSDEKSWGPWMVKHRVVAASHSCRPCNLDGCGNGKISDCLQAINPIMVLDTVIALIEEIRQ
jgi:heptosyltransferase-3